MTKCEVCQKEMPDFSIYRGKRIIVPNVCSEKCLIDFINSIKANGNYMQYVVSHTPLMKFESELEEIFHRKLRKYFDIDYAPFLMRLPNRKSFIPDFFIRKKKVFFEIKGVKERMTKAIVASNLFNLYIITPEIMKYWGWL